MNAWSTNPRRTPSSLPTTALMPSPRQPAKVFRKGKPDGFSQPLPFLYTISLQLPTALKEAARYTIRFVGVNTSKEIVAYVHKPSRNAKHCVHAIQTGYRPDDPYKRAYLSFWMGVDQDGKSGSCTHEVTTFGAPGRRGQGCVFRGSQACEEGRRGGADQRPREGGLYKGGSVPAGFQLLPRARRIPRVRSRYRVERSVPYCRRRLGKTVQGSHAGDPGATAGH